MLLDFLNTKVTAKSIKSLEELLELVDISKFRNNLRIMMVLFLMDEHNDLMPDNKEFIIEMTFVFEFLETVEQEAKMNKQQIKINADQRGI